MVHSLAINCTSDPTKQNLNRFTSTRKKQTLTEMIDNIDMDSTIPGSVNVFSVLLRLTASGYNFGIFLNYLQINK
jgi:hypothetical protein